MGVFADRRKRVLSLAKGREVVATKGANLFWLTDFWGAGAAVVRDDKTIVVTSVLEENRARELGKEVEVVSVKKWAEVSGALARLLEKGDVYTDDDSELRRFKRFKMSPSLFLEARRMKDGMEVGRIMEASRGLDRIFEALPHELRPGRTEWEVAAEVMKVATQNGLTPSGSDSTLSPIIVASGENGALPHCELTDRRMKEGDFVVADIFFRCKGYNSDATRTFAVGRASPEMKRSYKAVLEAQENALELIRVGTACKDVNDEAVRTLRKHGLDKYLNHSIGHGVGIDIHELPKISKDSETALVRNDVVTDEPGVYFLGKYGVRIEDTVKTDRKPEVLTRYTKELVTAG